MSAHATVIRPYSVSRASPSLGVAASASIQWLDNTRIECGHMGGSGDEEKRSQLGDEEYHDHQGGTAAMISEFQQIGDDDAGRGKQRRCQ